MNNHATSTHGLHHEEKATLLSDEKPPSDDLENAARLATALNSRFPKWRKTHPAPLLLPLLRRTAIFLLPSFLQPPLSPSTPPPSSPHNKSKPNPTAYLDGLRGLAALIVFFCHYLYTSFTIAPGHGTAHSHHHLPELPYSPLSASSSPARPCT
ncbi:hypothetical protein C8A00DRAFT_30861 [Chaetomidium leptoderma]|uniref:Acyltransferase 3 domain-containing protein n=1 Tax=Chaetomidium leptoderma TaxID=669021 RepID=A0AAN6VSW6_9PEZI|nr:hypothetical protein C8A00DRAFT_30861 [Chaetomidium leptoderma]